jgi:uncharacterized membrane protein
MSSMIEKSIEVGVDVTTAYNQWTQFEDFPEFMNNVVEVRQLDDTTLQWTMEIAGAEREWRADITEQKPDERIAWKAQGDIHHAGVVTFHHIDDDASRVMLQFEYEPEDWKEKAADAVNMTERRVEGDLERFKEFIEERGLETGAWRGEVDQERKTA